jgi:hypothetical protein
MLALVLLQVRGSRRQTAGPLGELMGVGAHGPGALALQMVSGRGLQCDTRWYLLLVLYWPS